MNDTKVLNRAADNIRILAASMVEKAKSGHPGGSLSATEIFTYLYFKEMNIDPKNPKWANRDRFVLSNGRRKVLRCPRFRTLRGFGNRF